MEALSRPSIRGHAAPRGGRGRLAFPTHFNICSSFTVFDDAHVAVGLDRFKSLSTLVPSLLYGVFEQLPAMLRNRSEAFFSSLQV